MLDVTAVNCHWHLCFAKISFHVLRPMQSQLTRERGHEHHRRCVPPPWPPTETWTRVREPPRATLTTARRPLGESLTRLLRDQEPGLDVPRTDFRSASDRPLPPPTFHYSDQLTLSPFSPGNLRPPGSAACATTFSSILLPRNGNSRNARNVSVATTMAASFRKNLLLPDFGQRTRNIRFADTSKSDLKLKQVANTSPSVTRN